ncbi:MULTISPECIES: GGDEF domain-containing protein [unclassified Shinella]|jgi:diguanylate cyclase|uniref:GGDEF domain-containing protein n=1 Tax=unclassified Shinella TaxID=2643062 RepID=UPI0006810BC3|nr:MULTISPECIES: GGDEF domain-containing protein [unclassified Shinella]TAA63158.1 GGDEF domain-containing protein [Shinella sp. JR1-6]
MMTDKTLLEQMRINEIEIFHRMQLLDLSQDELDLIASLKKLIESEIEDIVEAFYRHQTEFDEISIVIGDSETMRRLRAAQRKYIIEMFSGYYDGEYVNSRLRIGLVHKRIGVEPKLFLSGVRTLKHILFSTLERHFADPAILRPIMVAIDKLFFFDITLVFDTYIDTLVSEVESAKKRTEAYAYALEEKAKTLGNHAERDSLTGLYNKRGMMKIMKSELRMAQRRHTLLSLIYIDVNKFKHINDTYGHAKGDEILISLGHCMSNQVRSADFACRVGGDEFCVILPDCDHAGAQQIAQRIASEFSLENPDFSISIGVSETGTQEYMSEDALIKDADQRMYLHKTGANLRAGAAPEQTAQKRYKAAG